MSLYLFQDDFKEVFEKIKDQFDNAPEYDGGTLFVYKYGNLRKDNMEFGLGVEDTMLFYHHHPMDADSYTMYSVRSVYEELILLKTHRTKEEDIIYKQIGGESAINLGRMIERREATNEKLRMDEWEKQNQVKVNVPKDSQEVGSKISQSKQEQEAIVSRFGGQRKEIKSPGFIKQKVRQRQRRLRNNWN